MALSIRTQEMQQQEDSFGMNSGSASQRLVSAWVNAQL
ncbi:hypothetical protein LINPERPRIM_LOCUS32845 [Linum perenne]